jgi:CRP-like cAMP-binding protein
VNQFSRASDPSSSPNRLLARLPADDYRRLLPDLDVVPLRAGLVLLKREAAAPKVHFLGGGVCSIELATADGQVAAVALIGNEGCLGTSVVAGDPESGQTAVIDVVDGEAQVMTVTAFRREMERRTAFHDVIHHYEQAFVEGVMQSVACNALHPIEKRCARCLLELRDRIGRNEFPVTQELLARLLGVRRASVTLAAGALHRAGIIDTVHKSVIIREPAALEAVACECYALIKGHFARLLP